MAEKNCGSCKWLSVPTDELVESGTRTHKRYNFFMYRCDVPFELPPFPARFRVEIVDQKMSCPAYGEHCAFHEFRQSHR